LCLGGEGMIKIENLVKEFELNSSKLKAVDDVSLEVKAGEIFGIIGYSGAGKSTLLRIINQLEIQTSGKVLIDGVDISALNKKQLLQSRQKIGMIFQHFNLLWSKTILENVMLPLSFAKVDNSKAKTKALDLINLVGLSGRENSYPSELSGGQKQRVAIARAVANDPKILLCDEATSALDPQTTVSILDLLKKINREFNLTIVMITHQMEVAQKICHRIAVMSDGKLCEVNTVQEIFEHPQHEVTKSFVNKTDDIEMQECLNDLKRNNPEGKLLKLLFLGKETTEPILANIVKNSVIDVNIVYSNINLTSYGSIGEMYILVTNGLDSDYREFINELVRKNVEVKEL